MSGWSRIRTYVALTRRIYSPLPLATRASIRTCAVGGVRRRTDAGVSQSWRWDLNPQPPDYKSGALPLSYTSKTSKFWPCSSRDSFSLTSCQVGAVYISENPCCQYGMCRFALKRPNTPLGAVRTRPGHQAEAGGADRCGPTLRPRARLRQAANRPSSREREGPTLGTWHPSSPSRRRGPLAVRPRIRRTRSRAQASALAATPC